MTLCGVLWPPRRYRAIGSASSGPLAVAERLPAVVVGATELLLPPPAAPDGLPTDSKHAECGGDIAGRPQKYTVGSHKSVPPDLLLPNRVQFGLWKFTYMNVYS